MKRETISKTPYRIFASIMRPFRTSSEKDEISKVEAESIAFLRTLDRPRVLEIGSRDVSKVLNNNIFPNASEYVGFDILSGDNVDVVGDAHELASYFPENSFDIIYSSSVFEHLMFPWQVALECNKILKTGGYIMTRTHPVWPEHEMPWDFWRFPRNSFLAMFNPVTGFEVVHTVEGRSMRAFPLVSDWTMKGMHRYRLNASVFCLAKKVSDFDRERLRWDIKISEVVDTMYPRKKPE